MLPREIVARLNKVLVAEHEQMIGQLAVRHGLITHAQLREALLDQAASDAPRPLGSILLARGWIGTSQLVSLVEEQRRLQFAKNVVEACPDLPAEVRPYLLDPARNIDEYVLVAPLGRGGAGDVWKAWDRTLHRWVAVKMPVVAPQSREEWERFSREAQAAARLSHPNIVPIYRVGEHQGRPFIVMQLVEGRSLADLRLPLDRALRVLRQAALAVHHAHQNGVVHRDLKPGNIMLDDEGTVRILDFGLAHLIEGSRTLTDTGTISGTPAYMSPEQARGEAAAKDALTDVYSLGATLYELVTGRPPFAGGSVAEIVRQVCQADPVPPRRHNERLPREVETIILKAMDKEPRRRYATAADLAEDLRRFLDNEPILAQPPSLLRRVVKRMRRNPPAYAFAGAATAAVLIAILVWIAELDRARRLRQEQERLAAERAEALEVLRDTARLSLRAALELRRAGANAGMRQFMPALEAAYRRALERAPELAEVDYLMGRMHRALMMDDRALEFQDRALLKDPGFVPALYERVVLTARKYRKEYQDAFEAARALDEAPASPQDVRNLPRPNRSFIERQHPRLASLRRQIESDYEKLVQLSEADALAARGIWQYVLWNLSEAEVVLTEAVKKDPGLEEAWQALAHSMAIRAGSARGRLKERRWDEAEEIYTRALNHDRGYVPHLVGRAQVRFERGVYRHQHGVDPSLDYALAEQDLGEALRLDDSNADVWMRRGRVRSDRGRWRQKQGEDPLGDYALAEDDYAEALKRDPSYEFAWTFRGLLRINRGEWRARHGGDAATDWAAAEADLKQALRLRPGLALAQMYLGDVYRGRGRLQEALAAYTETLRLNPQIAEAWYRRGLTRYLVGRTKADPLEDWAAAEKDLSEAIRLDRDYIYASARAARGDVRLDRGEWTKSKKDFVAAAADYAAAIQAAPMLQGRIGPRKEAAEKRAREMR